MPKTQQLFVSLEILRRYRMGDTSKKCTRISSNFSAWITPDFSKVFFYFFIVRHQKPFENIRFHWISQFFLNLTDFVQISVDLFGFLLISHIFLFFPDFPGFLRFSRISNDLYGFLKISKFSKRNTSGFFKFTPLFFSLLESRFSPDF